MLAFLLLGFVVAQYNIVKRQAGSKLPKPVGRRLAGQIAQAA
jgi:F0F1-type ATP synthase assembly protein I